MIILKVYNWLDVGLGVLYVSLIVLVIAIAYRQLLRRFGKGEPIKANYLVLYALEKPVAEGEVVFYFTAESPRAFTFEILDKDLQLKTLVKEGDCTAGGNIIRFDSSVLENGTYYFRVRTENQNTMKKMQVKNA